MVNKKPNSVKEQGDILLYKISKLYFGTDLLVYRYNFCLGKYIKHQLNTKINICLQILTLYKLRIRPCCVLSNLQ